MVINALLRLIGEHFGEKYDPAHLGDPVEFNPGIAIDIGQTWITFIKKLLIPSYARWDHARDGCFKKCCSDQYEKEHSDTGKMTKRTSIYCQRASDPNRLKCIKDN